MKIFYIANARMPTEKAHGIQIAKMCEAFIEQGAEVTLVVPSRETVSSTVQAFYGLHMDIQTIRLPVLDTYRFGAAGFILGSLSFMVVSFLFVAWRRMKGEEFTVYTVDMDTFSSSLLPLAGAPVFTEMHNGKPVHLVQRFFFRYLRGVITINTILAKDFKQKFKNLHTRYAIEPNGVDAERFHSQDKSEARKRLGIAEDAHIALYVGRFFDWKGLEIIPAAAKRTADIVQWYMVGGTTEDFVRITHVQPESSMVFVGGVSQPEVVSWIAAADVLILLGTKRDQQSYYYTSPMKLFEYLLSERTIVASETPAIREIVSEKEVLFYNPDSAEDLAAKVREAVTAQGAMKNRIEAAAKLGQRHSWHDRARRILDFMSK
ncbi:MAG: glycosyltransferase family 4 protein [Candidatus Paceibacteria bacterium]